MVRIAAPIDNQAKRDKFTRDEWLISGNYKPEGYFQSKYLAMEGASYMTSAPACLLSVTEINKITANTSVVIHVYTGYTCLREIFSVWEVTMETTQNVTLAIPKDILRKAKILAVQKNTSLSGLLAQTLTDLVAHQDAYEQARQRNLTLLKSGFDLGTQGQIAWNREGLHDR